MRRLFRPDVQRDVDDEIAAHLEMRQREFEERGALPGEARQAAVRRFGNVAAVARECRAIDEAWYREQRRASMIHDLTQDIAYAIRWLARSPAFAGVAIVTLAVGIGATTAIFSLANWALLRPVPGVERSGEVRQIWTGRRTGPSAFRPSFVSYPNIHDVSARLQTLRIAGMQRATFSVGTGGGPARSVPGWFVSASFFDVLGVRMRAGRTFTDKEDSAAGPSTLLVVSEAFAASTFGGPDAAIGQVLKVNGIPCTVIGVTGHDFVGTDRTASYDLWMPGAAQPVVNYTPKLRVDDRRGVGFYEFVGRVTPGASWDQAEAELKTMAEWLAATYPQENARLAEIGFHILGPIGGFALTRQGIISMTWLMLAASVLVLLIACSNVASLLMMRGVGRGGEVAIRKALGAARVRLVRQHLTEGVLLWALGGAVAVLLVWLAMRSADGLALLGLRGGTADGVPIDWRVVAFAAGLSLLVGLVFSVAPALRASRVEAAAALRLETPASTPRGLWVGTSLTVAQLALLLTLVVGALLMVATIRQLARVDVGFDADGLYTFAIRPGSVGYSPARAVAYREEFERRLARVPGVERVAAAVRLPFAGTTMTTLVKVPGGQNVDTQATEIFSSTYFETLRIPLRRGRLFTQDDLGTGGAQARPVVVISDLLARRLFGTDDAVGRTIEFGTRGRGGRPFEVIGVVGDVRNGSLTEDAEPMIYEPAALAVPVRPDAMFAVRVRDGVDVAAAAQSIAADLDPALPLWFPMSMEEAVARARAEWDILAQLMTALAAVAVILASVGLYGVVAFGVAARRREFGIRLALGAPPASVMALVFRRTATMVVAGLILGASGAIVIARTLSAKLFGVAPFDPLVWTMAALALVVLAGIASWIPARRAVSADVTGALRAL